MIKDGEKTSLVQSEDIQRRCKEYFEELLTCENESDGPQLNKWRRSEQERHTLSWDQTDESLY